MYRTTKEENEILTRTGRGTPMGELLRRYWWPIGISADLKNKPTFIRVFAENLEAWRQSQRMGRSLAEHVAAFKTSGGHEMVDLPGGSSRWNLG